jgi:hypothetical protein
LCKIVLCISNLSNATLETVMRYIPSPTPIKFEYMYSATANKSGRMQYHKVRPGVSKIRISRTEFIKAFNDLAIIAVNPIQQRGQDIVFQLEFFV